MVTQQEPEVATRHLSRDSSLVREDDHAFAELGVESTVPDEVEDVPWRILELVEEILWRLALQPGKLDDPGSVSFATALSSRPFSRSTSSAG